MYRWYGTALGRATRFCPRGLTAAARSPDFLAYLEVASAAEGFEWSPDGKLLKRIENALASLDVVAFVPLKRPDEIAVAIEYPKRRARVDAGLKTMLREDDLGLLADGPRVVEVTGTRERRVARLNEVLAVRSG